MLIPLGAFYMYARTHDISFQDMSFRNFFLPGTPTMHIGEMPLRVEVLNTDAERIKGLSGRSEIGDADGLLFVFPKADYHGIWMKDMKFPIDIIWISEDWKVIGIDKNVQPDSYPKIFKPSRPARYVVETEIHFSDTFGLHEGLAVRLPLNDLNK